MCIPQIFLEDFNVWVCLYHHISYLCKYTHSMLREKQAIEVRIWTFIILILNYPYIQYIPAVTTQCLSSHFCSLKLILFCKVFLYIRIKYRNCLLEFCVLVTWLLIKVSFIECPMRLSHFLFIRILHIYFIFFWNIILLLESPFCCFSSVSFH